MYNDDDAYYEDELSYKKKDNRKEKKGKFIRHRQVNANDLNNNNNDGDED